MILIYSKHIIIIILIYFVLSCSGKRNNAPLSKNAPTDRPHKVNNIEQLEQYEKLIEPYVNQAKETLPKTKEKFVNGLNEGESFFLVTRIYDTEGNFEQIFVRVTDWKDDTIKGTIANDLNTVKGFKYGQLIEFPERDILDWLIALPDGSEEGNFVGKFLDTLK